MSFLHRVRRRTLIASSAAVLVVAGFGATIALGVGETTGTNTVVATACADANVPDRTFTGPSHVLSRDGGSVYTEPGDVVLSPGASDHQCQTATNVQTYTIPTVTQTVTTGGVSANLYASLDGSIASPPWTFEASAPQGGVPTGTFSWINDGFSGSAIRYHTPASATWDSGSSQLSSHFVGNGSAQASTAQGSTTWYRAHLRTDANYMPGEWDWLVEWHNDGNITHAVSSAWGLVSSGAIAGPNKGTSPLLEFRAMGGSDAAPTATRFKMAPGSWVPNTWHDLVAKITWGTTAATGSLSLWVDGQPFPGYTWPQNVPTLLYSGSTGAIDKPAFGIYNYHYKVTYPVDRDYDEVMDGPTAASINFTP